MKSITLASLTVGVALVFSSSVMAQTNSNPGGMTTGINAGSTGMSSQTQPGTTSARSEGSESTNGKHHMQRSKSMHHRGTSETGAGNSTSNMSGSAAGSAGPMGHSQSGGR